MKNCSKMPAILCSSWNSNLQRALLTMILHSCMMEDFGSSYSNLNAIRQLSFDSVKLSRSFFENGFPAEERSRDMIRGLIQLFKSLGIKVVAEGIENEQQKKALKDMRCDMIQGYFYSRPVTVSEFEKFRKWTEQNAIPGSGNQG